jgi:hypothetical protein
VSTSLDGIGRQHFQVQRKLRRQRLQHVDVGWEVVVAGDQRAPARLRMQSSSRGLVEVHRGRIADDDLAGPRLHDRLRDEVTQPARHMDPLAPGDDEVLAPGFERLRNQGRGSRGLAAQRIAVHVQCTVVINDEKPA